MMNVTPVSATPVRVLLVSTHDWFTSALQAVLEPEGFVFARVRSARHALRHLEQVTPDIVILSEKLPDVDAAGLVRMLLSGGLRGSVPLLVYSPNFWHEEEQAKAVSAGAWDIIREPLRPTILSAKLHRLLEIGQLIRVVEDGKAVHEDSELMTLAEMTESIGRIEATARRNAVPLSCVVIGPSRPGAGQVLEHQQSETVALCRDNLRVSDLWGWVNDADFGVVAYNTTAAGVITMVRRLNDRLSASDDGTLRPLSAGVIELPVDRENNSKVRETRSLVTKPRIASLSRLAAAQAALRDARAGGGGIRIGRPA